MKLQEKSFLKQYVDHETQTLKNVTASQLVEVWEHYDRDGNGFIEGSELDDFITEFVVTVAGDELGLTELSYDFITEFKNEFMAAFDDNEDNRIEISEMAQILPLEESFLLIFRRDNPLESSVDFMKLWKKYDLDRSGYIEANELKSFLIDLLKSINPGKEISELIILEYTSTVLTLFDRNGDGKLQLSEMARLLPIRENYLSRPIFKNGSRITKYDVQRILHHYDKNINGMIEDVELEGFLKDLLDLIQEDYDDEDIKFMKQVILTQWDVNHDGMINRNELEMILLQQSQSTNQR